MPGRLLLMPIHAYFNAKNALKYTDFRADSPKPLSLEWPDHRCWMHGCFALLRAGEDPISGYADMDPHGLTSHFSKALRGRCFFENWFFN
jgi:hypothetical protein